MFITQNFFNIYKEQISRFPLHHCIFEHYNEKLEEILDAQRKNGQVLKEWTDGNLGAPISISRDVKELKFVLDPTKRMFFDLDETATPYCLTPLHIAVMVQNVEAVTALCAAGADVNKQDARGWTPLHHAALQEDGKLYHVLQEHGADRNIADKLNGTPEKIRQFAMPQFLPEKEISHLSVTLSRDHSGTQKTSLSMTPERFKALTGADLLEEMSISPSLFFRSWIKPEQVNPDLSSMQKICPRNYLEHLKNPARLSIREVIHPGTKVPFCFGVYAEQKISKNQIICEYLGDKVDNPKSVENKDYLLEDTQGLNARNMGAMANDGFPNAGMVAVHSMNGLAIRSVLLALEDIKPGSQIFWNYKTAQLKTIGHIELNIEAARDFVKHHSITDIVNRTKECTKSLVYTYDLPHFEQFEKANYLMDTPSTALRLFFEERVSFAEIQLLADQQYNKNSFFTLHINQFFIPFNDIYASMHPNLQQAFRNNLEMYFENGRTQTIFHIIQNFILDSKKPKGFVALFLKSHRASQKQLNKLLCLYFTHIDTAVKEQGL